MLAYSSGGLASWYDPLIIPRGSLVAFTGMCVFLIGMWSITVLVDNLLLVFLFLEVS